MVGVFALHAAATYMAWAPEWWFVQSRPGSVVFTVVALVLDTTVMPLLFAVGGFAAARSMDGRDTWRNARQRLGRLGVPWLLGLAIFAPATTLFAAWARGYRVPAVPFVTQLYWGPAFNQGVYWFLGVLLAFNLLTPVLRRVPSASVVPASLALTLLASTQFPLDHWWAGLPLSFQPARTALLAACYVAGLHAARTPPAVPGPGGLAVAAMATQVAHLCARFFLSPGHPLTPGLTALAFVAAAWTTLALLAAMAPRYLSNPGPRATALARHALGIYLVHLLVLFPLAHAALSWPLHPLPRGLAVGALAFALTWLLCALLHRFVRPWRALVS